MYIITTVNNLRYGNYFQFYTGGTINIVVLKERNLLIYQNVLTKKVRKLKGFVDIDKQTQIARIRYCKSLDIMFNSYYLLRKEVENMPF